MADRAASREGAAEVEGRFRSSQGSMMSVSVAGQWLRSESCVKGRRHCSSRPGRPKEQSKESGVVAVVEVGGRAKCRKPNKEPFSLPQPE